MFNLFRNQKTYIDLSVQEFKEKMSEPDTVILDVRTEPEVADRKIPGAVSGMDYYNGEFDTKFPALDKSKTYLVYCRSGVRSAHACEKMAAAGFASLYNLKGGILAWEIST